MKSFARILSAKPCGVIDVGIGCSWVSSWHPQASFGQPSSFWEATATPNVGQTIIDTAGTCGDLTRRRIGTAEDRTGRPLFAPDTAALGPARARQRARGQ